MSRWVEAFESHPFQTTWTQLKENLEATVVDDKTIITDVKELARLKKIVSYIEILISGIDPELVPQSTWDNFESQAQPCNAKISQFISDRNIKNIQQANQHADNLLSYVKPYLLVKGNAATQIRKAMSDYAKTIEEYGNSFSLKSVDMLKEIEININKSNELLNYFVEIKEKVERIEEYIFSEDVEKLGIEKRVKEIYENIENKYGEINEFYDETVVGDTENPSTKKELQQAKEYVAIERKNIKDLLSSATEEMENLEKFYGSSAESVEVLRFRQISKCMI